MFCENCGHSLQENGFFCPECGFRQPQPGPQQQELQPSQPPPPQHPQPPQPQPQPQPPPPQPQQPQSQPQQPQPQPQQPQSPQPPPPLQPQQPQPQQLAYYQQDKKKRSGCLTAFLVTIGLAATAVLAVYFLLPGLARPYNLGVKSSEEDYSGTMHKLGVVKDEAPDTNAASEYKVVYGSLHDVQAELNSEEITSFFNENRPGYYSFKNVQVRVNADNTVDASGTINTDYVFSDVLKGNYTREDAKQALPMLGLLPDKVNFHCNIDGMVRDNKTQSLSINSISVMGVPIPGSLIGSEQAKAFVTSTLDGYLGTLSAKSGSSYDLLEVSDGKVKFEGKLPSSITHVPME